MHFLVPLNPDSYNKKIVKKKYGIIILGIIICATLFITCTADDTQPQVPEPLKGVSLSPKSYSEEDFLDFLEKVKETQDVLTWVGDWIELGKGTNPIVNPELSRQYDYVPIIEVGHYIQSSGDLLRPFSEENKNLYKESTITFVETYKPAYFGMGVEINIFAEKNPDEFSNFVQFYNELYEAIKTSSPSTKVFTVFQLEAMHGLSTWEIEEHSQSWEMIDIFRSDLAAFTTYPGLVYKDPTMIPEDHYSEIAKHTSKPVAFLEIGWHSEAYPPNWESSETEQAEFVETFFRLTEDLDTEIMIWSFMFDQETFKPFDSMGLINNNGTAKAAWDVWIK